MSVREQERALLELIEIDRDHRCAEIMDRARRQAAELLHQAHSQARERVRSGLNEARARARERIAAAAAHKQTRMRLAQQGSASDFLARAMKLLPAALTARWQQSDARLTWVRQALLQARQSLPPGDWRIEHAPGLTDIDIAALRDERLTPFQHHFEVDARLGAGVRIHGNGNCIDASLAGLLGDRDSLAARLLRTWEASR